MFSFEFMQNAYLAGTLIAIVSGMMGVFVTARNMPFMTHTLSEIGFAGAAFGIFVGWTPLNGMLTFTTISSILVGELSGKVESRREASSVQFRGSLLVLGFSFYRFPIKIPATRPTFCSAVSSALVDRTFFRWLVCRPWFCWFFF
ncbi:zinc ABC transporter, inner membrane permease protein ZnuB [Lentilactobacillus farraginis DSM 18382 = JCM 14108]|uniref:Zinc ABC transporter, inner membrane permease protein ZnuB n=1 Tax=Lentilactobacillus farraginis DSM 18382 = JCM 14108 TaxID=1423743 RepID=X0PA91_9LACO|nr:zinc ABC transporter, inner membrane permease protein ZnuB [Lentilactobacillus farraginis DSM 18382 = JCM 14108]